MKSRVVSVADPGVEIMTTGIFSVSGRDKSKIRDRQLKAIEELEFLLTNAMGFQIDAQGLDLMKQMLKVDGTQRISPPDALKHPFLKL
eukprot:CAMPEP_0116939750 /NCGR_PEP_ID=MMETSP0467-20121206/32939_1 /TAXON_ID=283647 /ORGANISM="Mesodinium pulex, Strain SPMC105" /LENGTH=87 /DNA_ID=CAMNT_0004622123 /DNA_START=1248 /DNA_END=1511 /DNA_ORIENTATION=+